MGDFIISGAGFVTFVTLPSLLWRNIDSPFPHTKKDISYTYYSPVRESRRRRHTKKQDANYEVTKVTNLARFLTNYSKLFSHGGLYHIWGRICYLCYLPPSSGGM